MYTHASKGQTARRTDGRMPLDRREEEGEGEEGEEVVVAGAGLRVKEEGGDSVHPARYRLPSTEGAANANALVRGGAAAAKKKMKAKTDRVAG